MPVRDRRPDGIRFFDAMGCELYWGGGEFADTDCPFCGREKKMHVKADKTFWGCRSTSCDMGWEPGDDAKEQEPKGRNAVVFLRRIWRLSDRETTSQDYEEVRRHRRLIYGDTAMRWGMMVKSVLTGEWLLPGYNGEGNLVQCHRIELEKQGCTARAMPTLSLGLFGYGTWDVNKPSVFLVEGPWDGMALWETMQACGWDEKRERLIETHDAGRTLGAEANVLAVPGAGTYVARWNKLFSNKTVYLMFDSDHPKGNADPAGMAGMRRTTGVLSQAKPAPTKINWLKWTDAGHDPDLPDGWDVRDALVKG